MIASHLPDLSNWQLLANKISSKNFEKAPILQPQFFAQNLNLIFPQEYETDVENSAVIKIQKPDNYQKEIFAFSTPIKKDSLFAIDFFKKDRKKSTSANNFSQCSSLNQSARQVELSCNFPKSGKYKVLILDGDKNSSSEKINLLGELKFS